MKTVPLARLLLCGFAAAIIAGGAAAQQYPSKTITMIVPFPAGGTTDILARPIAQKLSEKLGQQVIVDNRPGAGGTLGAGIVAKAASDGHTLLVAAVHHTIATSLYKKLPYNFEKDLAPVTVIAFVPNVMLVNPSLPVKNVKDVIAMAKAQPGKLAYGSAGAGTTHHIAGEMFKTMAGIDIVHVPYKGGAPMMTDLIGGQVQMAFETSASAMSQIRGGKVKPLAVTTAKRSPALPDIPTIAESGIAGYELTTWYGVVAPAGTPKEIISKLQTEIANMLKTPDMKKRWEEQAAEPGGITPEEFAKIIHADTVKYAKVVKESGATVD
jgi:tripartite-type tricarboxylate transporter receptor subunit TctC